jgi:hypothetical protein
MPGQISLLNQAGGDLEVGIHVPRIDPDRHAARALAEVGVLAPLLAVMIDDPVLAGDRPADHLDDFFRLTFAVQAGGHEDCDLVARNPLALENLQHRPQDQLVGDRPRNVADDDAGIFLPAGDFFQRRSAVGFFQHLQQVTAGIGQRRRVLVFERTDDVPIRQFCRQTGAAVFELDAH